MIAEADAKMATLTEENSSGQREQHMLQALLQDRFQAEDALGDEGGRRLQHGGWQSGSKLGKAERCRCQPRRRRSLSTIRCRPSSQKCAGQGCDYIAHGCSMDQLVGILTRAQFGRPVTDKTGLARQVRLCAEVQGALGSGPKRRRHGPNTANGQGVARGAWAEG